MNNKSHFRIGKQTAATVNSALRQRGKSTTEIVAVTPQRTVIMSEIALLHLSAEFPRAGAIVAAIYQSKGCISGCVTERAIRAERKMAR